MRQLNYPADRIEIDNIINARAYDENMQLKDIVDRVINDVRNRGDDALLEYTAKFDGVKLKDLEVSKEEIEKAYKEVDMNFFSSVKKAIEKIEGFHRKQLKESWFTFDNENMLGQLIRPLQRIGAYVPGGRAAYPSSVLMTIIPAKVAGVEEFMIVSPPDKKGRINSYTLVVADILGVKEIYKIGGAQAIAALAYGTNTIKAVDKIVGPGNIYVTLAKKSVYGRVGIDMLAGPSEVMILADKSTRADFIAADLLSQAEHDPMAVPILVTDDIKLARESIKELEKQIVRLPRKDIALSSWENKGLVIMVDNIEDGISLVNKFAPEHLELLVENPFYYLDKIKNAGAIFLGEYSPEPLGDYMAGPNHVLPTGGTANFASPLSTEDFLKKSSIISYKKKSLNILSADIKRLAELEGLDGHAAAINIRFRKGD
jgi:histidinol dehydrogenase